MVREFERKPEKSEPRTERIKHCGHLWEPVQWPNETAVRINRDWFRPSECEPSIARWRSLTAHGILILLVLSTSILYFASLSLSFSIYLSVCLSVFCLSSCAATLHVKSICLRYPSFGYLDIRYSSDFRISSCSKFCEKHKVNQPGGNLRRRIAQSDSKCYLFSRGN